MYMKRRRMRMHIGESVQNGCNSLENMNLMLWRVHRAKEAIHRKDVHRLFFERERDRGQHQDVTRH